MALLASDALMPPPTFVRGAERTAAILLIGLAAFPFLFAYQIATLIATMTDWNALSVVFALVAWLLVGAGLLLIGIAVSIWMATRLGPALGLIAALVVLVMASNDIRAAVAFVADGGHPKDGPDPILPTVMALAALGASMLLGWALWVRVRQARDG